MTTHQVFISYSTKDSVMAQKLYTVLEIAGANPFLAELNLQPGVRWKEEVLNALRNAPWVFFLATPNSCPSQAVAHEIGASLVLNKKLIPLMWNVKPQDLPPWVDDRQAVDLSDGQKVVQLVQNIGATINADRFVQGLVLGGLLGLAVWAFSKE